MTNNYEKSIFELLIGFATPMLVMASVFGLIFIADRQDKDWHKENDICNSTCTDHIDDNQMLTKYEKQFKFSEHNNLTCICSIKECIVDSFSKNEQPCTTKLCKSSDCKIFEKKTLYVDSP